MDIVKRESGQGGSGTHASELQTGEDSRRSRSEGRKRPLSAASRRRLAKREHRHDEIQKLISVGAKMASPKADLNQEEKQTRRKVRCWKLTHMPCHSHSSKAHVASSSSLEQAALDWWLDRNSGDQATMVWAREKQRNVQVSDAENTPAGNGQGGPITGSANAASKTANAAEERRRLELECVA